MAPRLSYPRVMVSSVTTLSLLACPAHASNTSAPDKDQARAGFVLMLQIAATGRVDELLDLLQHQGLALDEINAVRADLARAKAKQEKSIATTNKRSLDTPLRWSLKDDEIRLEDHRTGVSISSWTPMKLKVNSRIWRYQGSRSFDRNYFDLLKLFDPSHRASRTSQWIDVLLPGAAADALDEIQSAYYSRTGQMITKAYIWSQLGVLLTVGLAFLGAPFWPVLLVSLAVTSAFGAMKGFSEGNSSQARRLIQDLLASNKTSLYCSETGVTFSASLKEGESQLRVDRASRPPTVRLLDAKGRAVKDGALSDDLKNNIATAMQSCRSEADAKTILASWQKSALELQKKFDGPERSMQ